MPFDCAPYSASENPARELKLPIEFERALGTLIGLCGCRVAAFWRVWLGKVGHVAIPFNRHHDVCRLTSITLLRPAYSDKVATEEGFAPIRKPYSSEVLRRTVAAAMKENSQCADCSRSTHARPRSSV